MLIMASRTRRDIRGVFLVEGPEMARRSKPSAFDSHPLQSDAAFDCNKVAIYILSEANSGGSARCRAE